MGLLGTGRREAMMDRLRARRAMVASRLANLTAKLGSARNPVVRARIVDRINLLTARLAKIDGKLGQG